MAATGRPGILLVDDDQRLLDGLMRVLRDHFAVITATSGLAALTALRTQGPFAVIVSDMQMPNMNGIELLRQARSLAPYTVRVLLTGQADLQAAIDAVNEGHLFRFLTKPCYPRVLIAALNAAVEQRRLLVAERVLLERTLHGSIRALTELLALSQPAAFGRASRAKFDMTDLAAKFGVEDGWLLEIAAMLSHIGCVTLPPDTAARIYDGQMLGPVEAQMADGLPGVAADLLGNIPRLEPVQEILRYQQKQFDGGGIPADTVQGEAIPWGARALKVSLDFDVLITQGYSVSAALVVMHGRSGWYDPVILSAFSELRAGTVPLGHVKDIPLSQVAPGMKLVEDVRSPTGALLIARGQEVTVSLAARLRHLGPEHVPATVKVAAIPRSERRSTLTRRLQQASSDEPTVASSAARA